MTPPMLRIRPGLKAFAAELRAARIRAGLSKQTLADRAAMTRHGLIKIEKGGNPTLGTIILLADALGCEIADLFPRKHRWGAGVSDWHLRSRVLRNGP